jgi:Zn-dependent membrane protease YugP
MFGYLIFMLPAMILAGLATLFTKITFAKYAKREASSRMSGEQAARRMLTMQGVTDVKIEPVSGFLSDHYDPMTRTLRLSPGVYQSTSLSAIGVACHEAGHALQHAEHYAPLTLRSAMVPVTQFGSSASYIVFMLGMFLGSLMMLKLGILLFALVVVFALVTLPVEWNATARAKLLMVRAGIVSQSEQGMAGKVLNAAFLTYVASAFTALMTLLYYLMRAGLLGGRRSD